MFMPGGWEWMVVFAVALIVFGPKRLPEIGRQIGKGMRLFREASREIQNHLNLDELDTPSYRRPPKRVDVPSIPESTGYDSESHDYDYDPEGTAYNSDYTDYGSSEPESESTGYVEETTDYEPEPTAYSDEGTPYESESPETNTETYKEDTSKVENDSSSEEGPYGVSSEELRD